MPIAISPYHYDTDFPNGLSLEQKIEVFSARVQGWQLDPAHRLINSDMHSGFAVLHILTSYFETIAQYYRGELSGRSSKEFFKFGFKKFLEATRITVISDKPENENTLSVRENEVDKMLDDLYTSIRCGLYHSGLVKSNVMINGNFSFALAYDLRNGYFHLNPQQLPSAKKAHLHQYVGELRNPQNDELRRNFERVFDVLSADNFPTTDED